MSRFTIVCLIGLLGAARGPADESEDGIYALKAAGEGRRIKLSGGAEVILGERRGSTWAQAAIRSVANDNSRFVVQLKNVGPLDNRGGPATIVLLIDGVGMPFASRSSYPDGVLDLAFAVTGEEAARKVAA